MSDSQLWKRVKGSYLRASAKMLYRRSLLIDSGFPIISFTFDDFPRSALHTGGAILKRYGVTGTYYVSFGLMGKQAPTGTMFLREDIETLLEHGHELGCHTFDHCSAGETKPVRFEEPAGALRAVPWNCFSDVVLSDQPAAGEDKTKSWAAFRVLSRWRANFQCGKRGPQLSGFSFSGAEQGQAPCSPGSDQRESRSVRMADILDSRYLRDTHSMGMHA